METLSLDAIPVGNIVRYKNGEKHYEVLSDYKIKMLDNGVVYQGSPSSQFHIIKEKDMKIYKEQEEVSFTIGSKTFNGYILKNHVCIKNDTNSSVFNALGIKDREEFCSKYYGYKADCGGWPECKYGDYESLSRLIHALQELCNEHNKKPIQKFFNTGDKVRVIANHPDPHRFKIGEIVTIKNYNNTGDRYYCTKNEQAWHIDSNCIEKVEDITTQVPNVGDWIKCISHSNQWSEKFDIGRTYKVRAISQESYSISKFGNIEFWVPKQDFVLCNDEPQDDSEWKVGDILECIDKTLSGLRDCTVGKCYKIYRFTTGKNPSIIDDNNDNVDLVAFRREGFKKIINNQKQQLYVKDTSNSIELCSTFGTISTGETYRGKAISSSGIEIWI